MTGPLERLARECVEAGWHRDDIIDLLVCDLLAEWSYLARSLTAFMAGIDDTA